LKEGHWKMAIRKWPSWPQQTSTAAHAQAARADVARSVTLVGT